MGGAPRASRESGDRSADGEIQPFDERGLNAPGEALGTKRLPKLIWLAKNDLVSDFSYPAPAIPFNDLGVEQLSSDDPNAAALADGLDPIPEMRGQGVEVERQAIGGEDR